MSICSLTYKLNKQKQAYLYREKICVWEQNRR